MMDEATASVDFRTDQLLQRSLREVFVSVSLLIVFRYSLDGPDFAQCTMITIAHRIDTIIDSHRILVMDAGEVAEFDTPNNLLSNDSSKFSQMVHELDSNSVLALKERAMNAEVYTSSQEAVAAADSWTLETAQV